MADESTHRASDLVDRAVPMVPSAAAILLTEDDRYLLQLRDDVPGIWFPGHWGLFGGSIDPGETPLQALHRELQEELELSVQDCRFFTEIAFDLRPFGKQVRTRICFEVPIKTKDAGACVQHEGSDMRLFSLHDIVNGLRITPHDRFAIGLHAAQSHLREMRD